MKRLACALLIGLASCSREDVRNAGESFASAAPAVAGDAVVVAQVVGRLVQIDGDSALHVAVASNDGRVKLSGRVKSAATSQRFAAAARAVPGVKSVATSLTVDAALPSAKKSAADLVLAAAVRANLTGQAGINGIGVGIVARDGRVTLSGRVKSDALHATLVDAAKATAGVRSVDDRLKAGS